MERLCPKEIYHWSVSKDAFWSSVDFERTIHFKWLTKLS